MQNEIVVHFSPQIVKNYGEHSGGGWLEKVNGWGGDLIVLTIMVKKKKNFMMTTEKH